MENQFDLGLNIASIEAELPDPVITLSGADTFTASDTAEMPLLVLTAYGRSWQDERIVNIVDIGISGHGIPVDSGGNYTDSNGQQWVCDKLIVNADGSGKIVKNTSAIVFSGNERFNIVDGSLISAELSWLNMPKMQLLPQNTAQAKATALFSAGTVGSQATVYSGTDVVGFSEWSNVQFIYFSMKHFTDVDSFKAFLKTAADNSSPVTLAYLLETPEETELTTEQTATLQPVIDKYGAFTAYFMSTQDGVPTPENPIEIVSTADLHRVSVPIENIGDNESLTVTTQDKTAINIADIGIEGYGIPVSSGGNYTDSNGQQWVCDKIIVNADGTGKIINNTAIVTLNGSEDEKWAISESITRIITNYIARTAAPNPDTTGKLTMPIISNLLTAVSPVATYNNVQGISLDYKSAVQLCITSLSGTDDVDMWTTYLAENPITVVYQLAVSNETELTTEQMETLTPLVNQYGAFTAYFMSTQDGTPTPENPIEIVSTADLHKFATAEITTGLPLRGIPVSSGGNYTDSNSQEWICDTLEHLYGEPAQITKRVKESTVTQLYDAKGGNAIWIQTSTGNITTWVYGKYGTANWLDGRWYFSVLGAFLKENYRNGVFVNSENLGSTAYTSSAVSEIIGDWKNSADGAQFISEWTNQNGEPRTGALPMYALANGDKLPKEFLSTMGGIYDGAEIIYPSEAKTILLTTAETEALNSLSGYSGTTTVYNENAAEMTVKLLKEDYDMQYIHWIKESQTFLCEKAGKYKIICVGGGSSGGIGAVGTSGTLQAAGTTTSFGSIISAEGGGKTRTSLNASQMVSLCGGQSGYDGINYGSTAHMLAASTSGGTGTTVAGGESALMWGTGHGYGAGGGAKGTTASYSLSGESTVKQTFLAPASGKCGKVESTIVDLEANQAVVCTIGGGGVLNLSDQNVLDYFKNYVSASTATVSAAGAEISACVSNGADGVIIIQYLGV